jgi:hypothetical protein
VLAAADPLHDAKAAAEVLAPLALDDAVRSLARAATTAPPVRLRALRVARALDLAARIRSRPRDLDWWLALHEITSFHEAAAASLLRRAFAGEEARSAAVRELAAAAEVAQRFCTDWNEVRVPGDARDYAALEAELKAVAPACIPALLRVLAVPSHVAFSGPQPGRPTAARQQVRALLGLAVVLETPRAMPFHVMHVHGPSLTMTSNAAQCVQKLSGEDFGANGPLQRGDDARIRTWWKTHRAEHRAVLDHLVHAVAAWARADAPNEQLRPEGAWSALFALHRALGDDVDPPGGATPADLLARIDAFELAWLLAPR